MDPYEFDGYTWTPNADMSRFTRMGKPVSSAAGEGFGAWLSRGGPFADNSKLQAINNSASIPAANAPREVLARYKHPILKELGQ